MDRSDSFTTFAVRTPLMIRIRLIPFYSLLLLLVTSCSQMYDDTSTESTGGYPSAERVQEMAPDTVTKEELHQELEAAIKNADIRDYYKKVLREGKLIKAEDSLMLTITELLFTPEQDKDLFYFLVFTKSLNGADGFYSEAMGLAAMDFLRENTGAFTTYFDKAPKLTAVDLKNWADCIYGELQISEEGNEEQAIFDLEKDLLQNVKGSDQEGVIARFMATIRTERIEKQE